MQKVTYHCDGCKKKVETRESLVLFTIKYSYGRDYQYEEKVFELCDKCREKIGIVKRVVKGDEIVVEREKDTREKLYEIVCDIVNELIPEHLQN